MVLLAEQLTGVWCLTRHNHAVSDVVNGRHLWRDRNARSREGLKRVTENTIVLIHRCYLHQLVMVLNAGRFNVNYANVFLEIGHS
jgi:hypothetical protein